MTPSAPTPEELFRLFAGDEPEELRGYVYIPERGRPLALGSAVPLLVPQFRMDADQIAVPASALGAQPIDFFKTYVTINEYAIPQGEDQVVDVSDLIATLASIGTFRQRITDAAVLNHLVGRPADLAKAADEYPTFLKPEVAERFRNTLRPTTSDPGRLLLSRQGVLTAMREIVERFEVEGEPVDRSLVHSIALVHAVSSELYERRDQAEDSPTLAGMPASLAMDIVQNELFHRSHDELSLLYRHYLMWTKYGERVTRTTPRRKPAELLLEATGLDILDWIGFGFAVWAHRQRWSSGDPMWMPKSYIADAEPGRLDSFLALVSKDADGFRDQFSNSIGPWSFLPFQRHPLLEIDGDYLVLDESYLLERVTAGLYWEVHDHEREHEGNQARIVWTQTYAEMLERYAIDILTQLAPVVLGEGRAIYAEDEFKEAFDGKVCDAGVDFGADFCAIEVVSGQVKTGTRIGGATIDFEDDTNRLIIKKARQLDEATRSIVENEMALTGRSRPEERRVFPVIINVGTYPVNPVSSSYVEQLLADEDLLQDARIQPLSIIDISELEMLEGWSVSGGPTIPEALEGWKKSDLARMSLRNYGFAAFPEASKLQWRSPSLVAGAEPLFEAVIERLGLRDAAASETGSDGQ